MGFWLGEGKIKLMASLFINISSLYSKLDQRTSLSITRLQQQQPLLPALPPLLPLRPRLLPPSPFTTPPPSTLPPHPSISLFPPIYKKHPLSPTDTAKLTSNHTATQLQKLLLKLLGERFEKRRGDLAADLVWGIERSVEGGGWGWELGLEWAGLDLEWIGGVLGGFWFWNKMEKQIRKVQIITKIKN